MKGSLLPAGDGIDGAGGAVHGITGGEDTAAAGHHGLRVGVNGAHRAGIDAAVTGQAGKLRRLPDGEDDGIGGDGLLATLDHFEAGTPVVVE